MHQAFPWKSGEKYSRLAAHLGPCLLVVLWLTILGIAPGASAGERDVRWPIRAEAPLPVTQGFAEFGDVSPTKYHTGVDLGVPFGTPVYPIADGEVVLIQLLSETSDSGFGRSVIMRHSETGRTLYYSQYSHLSEIDETLVNACKPDRAPNDVTLTCVPGIALTVAYGLGKSGRSGYGVEEKWPAHLHIEIKSFGTLCTVDASGSVCGYSAAKPSTIGYFDPLDELLPLRPFPSPIPLDLTADSVSVRFTPDATRGARSITTLSRSDTAVPLRGLGYGDGLGCSWGWIKVRRVDDPNCASQSGASECFKDTRDPRAKPAAGYLGLVPTGWICSQYLLPSVVPSAREAVTHAVEFARGFVDVRRTRRGLTIELVDRDGLFSVYEAPRLAPGAVSDLWNLVFLEHFYESPPHEGFTSTHRDLAAALLARYSTSCTNAHTPEARATCAVTSIAKARGIRIGGGRYDEGQRCVIWDDRPGHAECE